LGVTRFACEQGRDPQRITVEIDAFNAAARELAARAHIDFFDITEISHKAADRIDMLTADGLHPSAAQYALWTDAITGVAKRALTESPSLRNG
jgi:lysophospholipase L1-like esterase